ncbi:MAG: hypothetical protein RLP15_13865 [Cryomorphaceae bacterium]
MKIIQTILVLIGITFASTSIAQKEVVEDTLLVKGICGMCKDRIEEAAYGKGVKYVSWDKATDQLSMAYRADKTSLEEIEKRILAAGHSTENHVAERDNYAKLPDCCKYETQHKH